MKKQRAIASEAPKTKETICSNPTADYNECQWQCVNNPPREAVCRTDKDGVFCRRKRCNAAGQWKEEIRLPANSQHSCDPAKIIIGPCDY